MVTLPDRKRTARRAHRAAGGVAVLETGVAAASFITAVHT